MTASPSPPISPFGRTAQALYPATQEDYFGPSVERHVAVITARLGGYSRYRSPRIGADEACGLTPFPLSPCSNVGSPGFVVSEVETPPHLESVQDADYASDRRAYAWALARRSWRGPVSQRDAGLDVEGRDFGVGFVEPVEDVEGQCRKKRKMSEMARDSWESVGKSVRKLGSLSLWRKKDSLIASPVDDGDGESLVASSGVASPVSDEGSGYERDDSSSSLTDDTDATESLGLSPPLEQCQRFNTPRLIRRRGKSMGQLGGVPMAGSQQPRSRSPPPPPVPDLSIKPAVSAVADRRPMLGVGNESVTSTQQLGNINVSTSQAMRAGDLGSETVQESPDGTPGHQSIHQEQVERTSESREVVQDQETATEERGRTAAQRTALGGGMTLDARLGEVRPLDSSGRIRYLAPVHRVVSQEAWGEAAALFAEDPVLRWRRWNLGDSS